MTDAMDSQRQNSPDSSKMTEEAHRLKFVQLREGLHKLLKKNGITTELGASNHDMLLGLKGLLGAKNHFDYIESLSSEWSEECRRFIQSILLILCPKDSEISPDCDIDQILGIAQKRILATKGI